MSASANPAQLPAAPAWRCCPPAARLAALDFVARELGMQLPPKLAQKQQHQNLFNGSSLIPLCHHRSDGRTHGGACALCCCSKSQLAQPPLHEQ